MSGSGVWRTWTGGDHEPAVNRFDLDRPPFDGAVQLRCTDHARFVAWINPPLPPEGVRVGCGTACSDADNIDDQDGDGS